MVTAISAQGFLMRSRMRVFFSGRQIYALSADLLCERVAALVAIAVRRTDGVEAAQLSFEQSIACEGCLGCFAPDKNLAAQVHASGFIAQTRRQRRLYY